MTADTAGTNTNGGIDRGKVKTIIHAEDKVTNKG